MSDPFEKVENSLRDLIADVLHDTYGDEWEEHLGVSDERLDRWRERREVQRKQAVGGVVEERLLYYADFHDIWTILKKKWELFSDCFRSKKRIEVYLDRLGELRNPDAHNRTAMPFEEHLAEGMSGELRQAITVFRNSGGGGPEPEHFCRIEEVRDSFNHRVTGLASGHHMVDTRDMVTLRPGERVELRGSGIDPADRPLRWRISAPFGSSELEIGEYSGSEFAVEWGVGENDIHDQQEIIVRLRSLDGPHRYGTYDDEARLLYRVLPQRGPAPRSGDLPSSGDANPNAH